MRQRQKGNPWQVLRDHIRDGERIDGRKSIGKRQRRRLRATGRTPEQQRQHNYERKRRRAAEAGGAR